MPKHLEEQQILKQIIAVNSDIRRYLDLAPTLNSKELKAEPGNQYMENISKSSKALLCRAKGINPQQA